MVQWLGFSAFTAVIYIQSLVAELRFRKLYSMAQKKLKTDKENNIQMIESKLEFVCKENQTSIKDEANV